MRPAIAQQQKQPVVDRLARIVVGFPAGGSSDTIARLYAEQLRGSYAPQLIVENRAGAGGRLAIEGVKGADPDGTTILQTPASMLTIYPHLYRQTLRYDTLTDFAPVSTVCIFPFALAVRADHPARDFAGFAAWARSQQGAVRFASPAAGSLPHFFGTQVGKALGIPVEHIPYRGTAPALTGLLTGDIPFVLVLLGEVAEQHRGGQVRILAISSSERVPRLSDLPTFSELGHPELVAEEWFAMLLPARTPAPIVDGLRRAIASAAEKPELREALAKLEYRPFVGAPEELAQLIRTERDRWGPIVLESGFKPVQ
jgi:tripartite-type tricarboxylate transporter receptor subunit TctC